MQVPKDFRFLSGFRMKQLAAKPSLFTIKPYIPGKPIEEVKRELGLREVIKLASNENPYEISPKVRKAIEAAIPTLNRYPDGDCFYLRKELSRILNVDSKQLIFGNGSDEIIVFAARAFLKKGDEVIVAQPSFLIYDIASKLEGAHVVSVPIQDFKYDLQGMKKAINAKTRIIFLGNPDNPAGSYFSQREFEEFIHDVPKDILIFCDEAYYEYVQAKDYVDSIALLRKYKNLFVTRTFSKMYGLAGLRIGYGVGSKELIDILNRVREPFNVNSLAQVAALACLKDKGYYKKIALKIEKQRQFLYENFTRLKLDFVKSCTNFILIQLNQEAGDVSKKLLQKGVIIRDMSHWGMKNFIRITIGNENENKKLIRVLEEVV